jgi:hypothetical protein
LRLRDQIEAPPSFGQISHQRPRDSRRFDSTEEDEVAEIE